MNTNKLESLNLKAAKLKRFCLIRCLAGYSGAAVVILLLALTQSPWWMNVLFGLGLAVFAVGNRASAYRKALRSVFDV